MDGFRIASLAPVFWVIFSGVLVVFGVYTTILLWHWKKYGSGRFTTVANAVLYLCVSAGFLFIMLSAVLTLTFFS